MVKWELETESSQVGRFLFTQIPQHPKPPRRIVGYTHWILCGMKCRRAEESVGLQVG